MKTILYILIALSLSSCMTLRYFDKHQEEICGKCPHEDVIIYRDSIIRHDTIIYRDSIVKVPIPGKPVYITDTLYINNGIVNLDTLIKEHGLIKVMAWVRNNILEVKGELTQDSIEYKINYFEKYHSIKEIHTEEITETDIVYKEKPFNKFLLYWFIGSLVLIILFLIFLYIRSKLKQSYFNAT